MHAPAKGVQLFFCQRSLLLCAHFFRFLPPEKISMPQQLLQPDQQASAILARALTRQSAGGKHLAAFAFQLTQPALAADGEFERAWL
jgi:hypothetical protein